MTSGKRAQYHSRLIRNPDSFGWPGAGSKGATHPQRAFIQMRKKFGTDRAATQQERDEHNACDADADCNVTPMNRQMQRPAVSFGQPANHRVVPFFRSLRIEEARPAPGRSASSRSARPDSANATVQAMGLNNRPSTRCSVKIGRYAVTMMAIAKNTGRCTSCVASKICCFGVLPSCIAPAEMPNDVLHHHDRAIHNHAEIKRS